MTIFKQPDLSVVKRLLQQNDLPSVDITEDILQTFLYEGARENPGGIIGLQVFGPVALLRSLVVAEEKRSLGVGQALLQAVEVDARDQGINELYLLTNTAEAFFVRHGYSSFERSRVPAKIAATEEFSSLCPDTASCMLKILN